jgi:hypothetical protein
LVLDANYLHKINNREQVFAGKIYDDGGEWRPKIIQKLDGLDWTCQAVDFSWGTHQNPTINQSFNRIPAVCFKFAFNCHSCVLHWETLRDCIITLISCLRFLEWITFCGRNWRFLYSIVRKNIKRKILENTIPINLHVIGSVEFQDHVGKLEFAKWLIERILRAETQWKLGQFYKKSSSKLSQHFI